MNVSLSDGYTAQMANNIWVVNKRESGWAVKREGDDALLSQHRTQQEAVDAARPIAQQEKVELIWHGEDGQVQGRDSYGNDPSDVPG